MSATVRPSHLPTPEKQREGARLRAARIVSRVSQRDLAVAFPYSRSFIAECERGLRPVPEDLQRWAAGRLRAIGQTEGAP